MVAGALSTGGLTALAAKLLRSKNDPQKVLFQKPLGKGK